MGTVTMPTPWAILALIGLAGLATLLIGTVVIALMGSRDRQRMQYLVKVGQFMVDAEDHSTSDLRKAWRP